MPAAALALGQAAQAGCRIVAQIAVARGCIRLRVEQQVAILRHKQEDHAVDQAQKLAVIILGIQLAGAQFRPQILVGRVGQEACAQRRDRFFHAIAQLVQGTGAAFLGRLGPFLQPALRT